MRRPRSPDAPGSSRHVRGFARAPPGSVVRRRVTPPREPTSLSPPGAARRPGRNRWRGGTARARRPMPGRARGAARGAARRASVPADLHGVADAVLGDDDVAGGVGLGEEDAEVGRVHPAGAVGAGRGVLGHLEPQVLPAAQGGGERRAAAGLALPVELGAHGAAQHRLLAPVEVHGGAERAAGRPFDMRAERPRRGVHEQHSSRGAQRPA